MFIIYAHVQLWFSAFDLLVLQTEVMYSPVCFLLEESDMLSNYLISSFPISKELVVFTAHSDDRYHKFHINLAMILWGLGCQYRVLMSYTG